MKMVRGPGTGQSGRQWARRGRVRVRTDNAATLKAARSEPQRHNRVQPVRTCGATAKVGNLYVNWW